MADIMKVSARAEDGNLVNCEVDGFNYIIDYPNPKDPEQELQGTKPGGLLVAALAGCKALVVRQFLEARDIKAPIDVQIEMSGSMDTGRYAVDCKVKLTIEGDVPEKYRELIMKHVDDNCAVEHVLLGTNNSVETEYVFN